MENNNKNREPLDSSDELKEYIGKATGFINEGKNKILDNIPSRSHLSDDIQEYMGKATGFHPKDKAIEEIKKIKAKQEQTKTSKSTLDWK